LPVRQRNDNPYPLTVHTDPPQVVEPGDVIDYDDPIVGLTVLDEPEPDAQAATEPAGKTTTKPTKADSGDKEATK
jgi:hypothetical protein